jgi:CRP-like cAMP-binding protein
MSIGERASSLFFQGLNGTQRELLSPLLKFCCFDANTVIFRQGDPAEKIYLLTDGLVQILFKPEDGPALIVSRLQPGEVFGWSSALRRVTYTSSAVSIIESKVYSINGLALHKLCEQHPEEGVVILEQLASAIAIRLDAMHGEIMNILNLGMELGGASSGKAE